MYNMPSIKSLFSHVSDWVAVHCSQSLKLSIAPVSSTEYNTLSFTSRSLTSCQNACLFRSSIGGCPIQVLPMP
jgi:hypothetical protein